MDLVINRKRLAETFITLCELSSPSRREKIVADYLKQTFSALEADFIHEDNSAAATGSDSGNLIVRFNGSRNSAPIFFACHMDTVNPGDGVQVRQDGDIFTSRGDTILGGDDKTGIASIIELVTLLKETGAAHRTIELIFTTCEEIGLLGAKNLEHQVLQAQFGYALDSTGIDKVIVGAPAANKIRLQVNGTAAHAGINPEAGVSAFLVAAQAIGRLQLGRIDEETTANIGIMQGGVATNIVPAELLIKGEVRSHSTEKLHRYTEKIRAAFDETAANWSVPDDTPQPSVDFTVESDYPAMLLADDDLAVVTVRTAGLALGRELSFVIAGGGSDANIYNSFGLTTAIIATGMNKVHTTDECCDLNDLVSLTRLIHAMAVA